MKYRLLRKIFAPLKKTPLHPQWLTFRNASDNLSEISTHLQGRLLDIGAGRQPIKPFLSPQAAYIALDFPESAKNYENHRPDVYGDGQQLPIATEAVDTVLLMDVLEHLPNPEHCIREIGRVLRPGGVAIVQVPFLYPVHDAPLDFHRWTLYGLKRMAERFGFSIVSERCTGTPVETAALLSNIAYSQTVLRWGKERNPLVLLGLLLPLFVLISNLTAWLLSRFTRPTHDGFMPFEYRMVWKKSA